MLVQCHALTGQRQKQISSLSLLQVFIHFLPKYIGMTRPKPDEQEEASEEKPIRGFNGRQPGGEYFIRKINPDLVMPWRSRYSQSPWKV